MHILWPGISILDERFLEKLKSKEFENLRLKLLKKLLQDELQLRERKNLKKYRSFKEMLEAMLQRYHANAITAAEAVQAMCKIRQEMQNEDERKTATGLSDDELVFYDAIVGLGDEVYNCRFICDLVREVVQAVKRSLKVDQATPRKRKASSHGRGQDGLAPPRYQSRAMPLHP